MPIYHDRVKDTTTTTGTGNLTLSGTAPTSFVNFNTAFSLNNPFIYCIVDATSGLWETGTGYLSASTTFVRDSVFEGSSGAGTLVNFSAGTKDVFCTLAAHAVEDFDSGAITAKINRLAMP
jgi:hypothetical protein